MRRAFSFASNWPGRIQYFLLVLILVVAAALRWYGLAWDKGYLFHPDERQIVLVASRLSVPHSISELVSLASPLNPHFFAYGSLPIYLLRIIGLVAPPAGVTGPWADPMLAGWAVSGRAVSGLFDLGTIVTTFILGRRLYDWRVGIVGATSVAVTVLHIQLSHFYAVDTLLAFFVVVTIYFALGVAEGGNGKFLILCGLSFGLALATKISALPLVFPILFGCYRHSLLKSKPLSLTRKESIRDVWKMARRPFAYVCLVAVIVFVAVQPYAVIDWYEFGRDVIREGVAARGWLDFPYTLQYAQTTPYIYQIEQSSIWGMGLPLGLFAWGGAGLFIWNSWKGRSWRSAFLLSWGLLYFVLIGAQFVKYPRYLLPLLPILYLMAAQTIFDLGAKRIVVAGALVFVLGLSLIYSVAFVSIYGRDHPWLKASDWIYENIPPHTVIISEQWDDALPVPLKVSGTDRTAAEYSSITLAMYEPDSLAKMQKIASALAQGGIVELSSQRAYGSLGRLPDRFPLTARYYQKLFDGTLGYEIVSTAANFPQLLGIQIQDNPRVGLPFDTVDPIATAPIILNWGLADESLSVYDHPQPIVFRNAMKLDEPRLLQLLGE